MSSKEIQIGFIRDKTTQFRNFRSSMNFQQNNSDIDSGLMGAGAMGELQAKGETHVLVAANNIEVLFATIQEEMRSLGEMHKNRLRANFTDNKTQDAAIEAKTRSISTQFTELRDRIRNTSQARNAETQIIEENMKMGFIARLRDMTTQFRDMQANYIQNIRRLNEKQQSFAADEDEKEGFGLEDFDPGLTGEQTSQIVANDLMLRQRNQELTQMIQMMNQLNELFADLGTLIIQQGTMLDRIDATVVEAHEEVLKGNQELVTAETHQKSKCFYIYIVLVVILIIIFGTVIIVRKEKARGNDQQQQQE